MLTPEQKQQYRDEFNKKFDNEYEHADCDECCGFLPDYEDMADFWLQKMEEREMEIIQVIETNKQRSNVADDESEEYWLDYEDLVKGIKNI